MFSPLLACLGSVSSILSFSPSLVRPSIPPHHGFLKSSSSCPNMLCSAPVGLTSQSNRGIGPTAGNDLPSPIFSVSPPPPSYSVQVTSCHSPPAFFSEPISTSLSVPLGPDVWGVEVTSDPRPRALSVMAVRPELDLLYKKMNKQNWGEGPGVCAMCGMSV